MAFNISKLARMSEFSMELDSLGCVDCLSLTTENLSQANKRLDSPSVQNQDVVRWLLGEMARHTDESRANKDDPIAGGSLSLEELSLVTNEKLDEFVGHLIQKNKYLLKTHKGKEMAKLLDETACDFLVRVFRHYAVEQKEQYQRLTEPLSKSLFASSTVEAMQRNLGLSSQLQNTIDKYARGHSGVEQILAKEREKWESMSNSLSKSLSASAAMEAMQRNTVEQSSLNALSEASRYMAEKTAIIANAMNIMSEPCMLRASINPYLESSASAMLAKAIYRNEDMVREAAGGMTQMGNISSIFETCIEKQRQATRDLLKIHGDMFHLPPSSETTRLLASYQVGAVAEFAKSHTKDTIDRQRFLETISTPWVNNGEAARSVTAILELQGMGNALRTIKGFDLGLTSALRQDLGDWRDKITFPESVFIDPVARTDFYVARGFNTALTDFPEAAYHQTLDLAGLDGERLNLELYGSVVRPAVDPNEEAGLQRTNKCHDWLQRFERRLRQFINDAMTAQYGSTWPKKRLDPKLYEKWEDKRQRAESSGTILTFIEVADFTDYETIICKQDHWREVFETKFKKKESVRESLQRLQPIRLTTMHGRIVTKEDELYLYAEVVRLLSAIK